MTFDQAHKSAMTSLSVFIIPIEFVFYTVGYNSFKSGAARLKKLAEEESNKKLESNDIINESDGTIEVELVDEEHPIVEEQNKEEIDEEHHVNQELIIESQQPNQELPRLSTLQKLKLYFYNNLENIKELLRNLLSPPLISIFVAILIALISPVKDFLITDPPMFISSVKNICKVFSQAVSPAALIILGGNLGMTLLKEENETLSNNIDTNEDETNLLKRIWIKMKATLIGILKIFKIKKIHPLAIAISLITKLIIFPLIGVGLVYAGIYLKILPTNDPLLILVILIQFSMPMAMSLTSLSSLSNDFGQEQVCELLLWHYLLCPLSLSLFSAWFLSLSCQLMGEEFSDKCNI
ncbi:predicted protein [Naegleria gruberi]|uniref:Predicted protein n=1 Tax=Naegleria gruberi TaxID=5762 RepID=D2W3B0_NAEGR|nr:uncharacterized protein NAEGRDRAFT_75883 [Naegleria gruberi]EFC36457.1 predicted protein [Naegleria gruberi]|eukprot:XP_002669201.1 predicted protein [Naegleria gruberi strain NEG-M]